MFGRTVRNFLTRAQKNSWKSDGYLVLPDFATEKQTDQLQKQALSLVDKWTPPKISTFFSAEDQRRQAADDYFLNSAGGIGYFLEEDSTDAEGKLKYPKDEWINKIGHALHDMDPVFEQFSYQPKVQELLKDLEYYAPSIVQSMYIMKPPRIGGVVSPHQDNSYVISEPNSWIGIWFAVDDARPDNACMWGIPGSQKSGTLKYWEKGESGMQLTNDQSYTTEGGVCLPAKKGTCIVLHGDFVHWSGLNTSLDKRHAYTIHVVETKETTWSPKGWLQRDNFKVINLQ